MLWQQFTVTPPVAANGYGPQNVICVAWPATAIQPLLIELHSVATSLALAASGNPPTYWATPDAIPAGTAIDVTPAGQAVTLLYLCRKLERTGASGAQLRATLTGLEPQLAGNPAVLAAVQNFLAAAPVVDPT